MSRLDWDRESARKRAEHEPLQSGRSYVDERKPITQPQRRLIRALRVELGIRDDGMPETNREARMLINSLITKRRAKSWWS